MEDRTVNFLWNAALRCDDVRSAGRESEAVKIHLRCLAEHRLKVYSLLPKTFSTKFMCNGCNGFWSCGKFTLRLVPSKPLTRRMKLLIQKDPSKLNKYQKKLRELCTKPQKNIMELKCLICEKITRIKLIKPEADRTSKATECGDSQSVESSSVKKKKKKRKRDSFAGLNASVVQMAQDHLEKSDSSLKLKKASHLKKKSLLNDSSSTLNATIEELNSKLNDSLEMSSEMNFQDGESSGIDSLLEFKSMKRPRDDSLETTPNIKCEGNVHSEHKQFNQILNKNKLSLSDLVILNRNKKKKNSDTLVNTFNETNLFEVSEMENNREINSNLKMRASTESSVQEMISSDNCVVSNAKKQNDSKPLEATEVVKIVAESVNVSLDKTSNGEAEKFLLLSHDKKKKSVDNKHSNNDLDLFNTAELQGTKKHEAALEQETFNKTHAKDTNYFSKQSTPNEKNKGKPPGESPTINSNSCRVSEIKNNVEQNQLSELKAVTQTPNSSSNSLNSSIVSTGKKKKKKKKKSNSCESPFPKAVTLSQQKKMNHLINSVNEIRPKKNSLMADFLNSL